MRYSLLALCLSVALGCGSAPQSDSPPTGPSSKDPSSADTAVGKLGDLKRVAADSLPGLAPPLGAKLDEGRLRVAAPDGWLVKPRSKDYLAMFVPESSTSIPRILVQLHDKIEHEFETLTEDNVEAFAKSVAEQFDEAQRAILEIRPMILGDRPCVRYVAFGKTDLHKVETQYLLTVVAGRAYRVDLTAYRQTTEEEPPITEHRDHAYAVMAGLAFDTEADPLNDTTE